MTNAVGFIQEGERLNYVNSSGSAIDYLQIVPSGAQVFIASEAIAIGDTGSLYTEGVFEVPAKTEAMAVGDDAYWDATNNYMTKTSLNNTYAGFVTEVKAQAAVTVRVSLIPGANTSGRIYGKLTIPVGSLATLTNGVKLVDTLPLGFIGRIESLHFKSGTTPASTASKDANLSLLLNAVAVTGGVLSLTTATVNAIGKVVAATAITALNTFIATDTLSVVAGSPTAIFVEGNGEVIITYSQAIQ